LPRSVPGFKSFIFQPRLDPTALGQALHPMEEKRCRVWAVCVGTNEDGLSALPGVVSPPHVTGIGEVTTAGLRACWVPFFGPGWQKRKMAL
jgi:hypothetical protein